MSTRDFVHICEAIADFFATADPRMRPRWRGYSYPSWVAARTLDRLPNAALVAVEKTTKAIGAAAKRVSREAERSRLRRALLHPEHLGPKLDLAVQRLDQLDIESQRDAE